VWGAVAATLVALPASIAFGVAVYGPLGGAGQGALAGILGATALGLLAPLVGGTARLISAPCAPAVAVMSALAADLLARNPTDPTRVAVLMTLATVLAGALQMLFGALRAGTIIKYIPWPVVTGYLSGVGVVIFLKQLPAFLGLQKGIALGHAVFTPGLWQWPAVVVGGATIAGMLVAPRITRALPPAIIGLFVGVATYFALGFARAELWTLEHNKLVIGPIGGGDASFLGALSARLTGLSGVHWADFGALLGPALTLAVLLSLDTLKTCVVVDALTGSRHQSNRELFGQGVANFASSLVGGMPGAGTSGATLVNIASGGTTRWSGVMEGGLVLVAFLALGPIVAWAPLSALSGILLVVAVRMFDWHAFSLLRQRSTTLDFVVIATVIGVAVAGDLIMASGVGVVLTILLFLRDQSRGVVIRRKLAGNRVFSKQRRLPAEMAVLEARGDATVVVELDGALFFGTTDQLRTKLDEDLRTRRFVILDLRRVRSVDLTAVHILEQMRAQLDKRGAFLLFCNLPRIVAGKSGDLRAYFEETGLVKPGEQTIFGNVSDALAFAEDALLHDDGKARGRELLLSLADFALLEGLPTTSLSALTRCVEERTVAAGETLFRRGDPGDELFLVRSGNVRIALQLEGHKTVHIASFGRGDHFGDMAFLDRGARSADAVAETNVELFAISRARFDALLKDEPALEVGLFSHLARSLAFRLRQADGEIAALEEA